MSTKKKIPQPDATSKFATRIWHWRAKKYLYASDYGIKAFPLRQT